MNTKKFSEAMGEIDSKYVERAINYQSKQKKYSWFKWGAIAACLCLLIVGSLNVGSLSLWKSGCSQTSHNVTLADGKMYYVYNNDVYLYELDNTTQKKIADFNGVLTHTQSGLYLTDMANGKVYSISGSMLTLAGSIAPDSTLIDVRTIRFIIGHIRMMESILSWRKI